MLTPHAHPMPATLHCRHAAGSAAGCALNPAGSHRILQWVLATAHHAEQMLKPWASCTAVRCIGLHVSR